MNILWQIITKLLEEVKRAGNCISNTRIENAAIKKPKPICWYLTCIKISITKALLFLAHWKTTINRSQHLYFIFFLKNRIKAPPNIVTIWSM